MIEILHCRLHGEDNVAIKRYVISFWNGVDLRYKLLQGPSALKYSRHRILCALSLFGEQFSVVCFSVFLQDGLILASEKRQRIAILQDKLFNVLCKGVRAVRAEEGTEALGENNATFFFVFSMFINS